MSLEDDLMPIVERMIAKRVGDGNWLTWPGPTHRCAINADWLQSLYRRINWERVADLVSDRIEDRIADKIFNSLATEVGNDTKSLMCDAKAREAFRFAIRERISAVCK